MYHIVIVDVERICRPCWHVHNQIKRARHQSLYLVAPSWVQCIITCEIGRNNYKRLLLNQINAKRRHDNVILQHVNGVEPVLQTYLETLKSEV